MKWEHAVINNLSRKIYLEGNFDIFPELWQYIPSIVYTCYYKSIESLDRDRRFQDDIVHDCIAEMWSLLRRKWDLLIKCDPNYFYSYYMRTATLVMKNSLARLSEDYEAFYNKDITELNLGVVYNWEDTYVKEEFLSNLSASFHKFITIWNSIYNRQPTKKELNTCIYPVLRQTLLKEFNNIKEVF